MEPFYLYNISAIIYTKSTERIILPMVADLYHLIIAMEWGDVNHESLTGLQKTAEELAKAAEQLAHIARRQAEESDDQVLKQEMLPAAKSLLVSGESILLVAQKLLIQPDVDRCIKELVASAKRVLVGTMKVLQTEDDAVIRRTIHIANWLIDCLLMLKSAEDVSATLVAFCNFAEASLVLTNQTGKLLWDLKESPLQKHLAETMQMFKKCIPVLHTATFNSLKHPSDQQVNVSKSYIFNCIESILQELISTLKENAGKKKLHEKNGLFPQHLNKLLGFLSNPQFTELYKGTLNFLVEGVVFYCMRLAYSSRATMKLKLVELCHRLLKLRKMIAMEVSSTIKGFPTENQLEERVKEKRRAMRVELESLSQAVHTAVLYQIIDNFSDTNGPLRKLVEAAVEPCSPVRKGDFLRKLQPLIAVFFSHSTQMLKAVDFVLVACTEMKTIQELEACVDRLSRLLAMVPTLLSEMSPSPGNNEISEKLHLLYQMWSSATESVLMCLAKIINLREFLDLTVQEMAIHKEQSEKALDQQNSRDFSWHAASLSNHARQVVGFVRRHVDGARDPVFRNGLLVLIKQLENAIRLVHMVADHCVGRVPSPQAKAAYSERTKDLIGSTECVRTGLDKCHQPDVLSPLREGIRNLNISKVSASCSSLQNLLDHGGQHTITPSTTDNSEGLEEFSARSVPVYCSSCTNPRESVLVSKAVAATVDLCPLISELIKATKTHDITRVNVACLNLLELSNCCTDAAKEALEVAKSSLSETLLCYKEIAALTLCLTSLARDVIENPVFNTEKFLETTVLLSKKICEAKQCLTLVASPWYSLSKQLLCIIFPCSFFHNTQTLEEIMQALGYVAQLAGKATLINQDDKELFLFPRLHETSLQVQAKFTSVQARTKQLLEKVPSLNNSDKAKVESFDGNCILWSVTIQAFLNTVDQFIGSDVLSLREVETTMKHQHCLKNALAVVSERSLRIQEVARLSCLLCAGHSAKTEIIVLKEQMKILTEALLEVAETLLSASPLSTPNLLVRFELLHRELAVTAKVLLLQLRVINKEYLNSIQNIVTRMQPLTCGSDVTNKKAFEKNAGQLMASVQRVKIIIRDEVFENLQLKESLLSTVDHLLLLTDEVIRRVQKLQSQLDKEHLLGDSIVIEWSANAGYLVTQLQSTKGIRETTLELIRKCLQNDDGQIQSSQAFGNVLPSLYKKLCRDLETGNLRASPTAIPGDSEKQWYDGCPISQMTKQMTTQMSDMTQFLKNKGPIKTKEQLIAWALQIISGGQAVVKFADIIAKNCLDSRCTTDLQNAIEQTKTISYQLTIISRVNASTGRSRSSAEHVVSNAQNLIQAVLQTLKAAEAACVKGLRQPPPNSEEADVAAFCSQWRKGLWCHRAKEALHSYRDELGLRRTETWTEPTFTSMIQQDSQLKSHS